MPQTGRKDDQGKPRMDLIPPDALFGAADVFGYGADKYADRNWEQGLSYGRLYAALQRHLWAWWSGEELDEESNAPHLDHALCCLMMLRSTWAHDLGEDTRPGAKPAIEALKHDKLATPLPRCAACENPGLGLPHVKWCGYGGLPWDATDKEPTP